MAIIKKQIGNELYVYMNGTLLYKKWLDRGYGIILNGFNTLSALGRAQGNFKASDVTQHITDKQK